MFLWNSLVIITKIITKIIVPRNYFVIVSARMVGFGHSTGQLNWTGHITKAPKSAGLQAIDCSRASMHLCPVILQFGPLWGGDTGRRVKQLPCGSLAVKPGNRAHVANLEGF